MECLEDRRLLAAVTSIDQDFDSPGSSYSLIEPVVDGTHGVQSGGPSGDYFRLNGTSSNSTKNGQPDLMLFDDTLIVSGHQIQASFDFRETVYSSGGSEGIRFTLYPAEMISSVSDAYLSWNPPYAIDLGQGFPGVFHLHFDTFDNHGTLSSEPNNNHIELSYNSDSARSGWLGSPTAPFDINDGQWHNVDLTLTPDGADGRLTLMVTAGADTHTIFDQTLIPGFVFNQDYRAALWVDYGAAISLHDIDNVSIAAINPEADYGDAPAPYPVTFEEDGARHGERSDQWLPVGDTLFGSQAGDRFGKGNLSADGRTIAVSSGATDLVGSAQVFRLEDGLWESVGGSFDIDHPHEPALNSDGSRIALVQNAKVAVYDWNGSAWNQFGSSIEHSYTSTYTRSFISDDGKTVAITNNEDSSGGAVTLFQEVEGQWQQRGASLVGQSSDRFGTDVDISQDGNRIVIGAPRISGVSYAKIYDWNGTEWVEVFTVNSLSSTEHAGVDVSISGDGSTVTVGAYLADVNGTDSGTVRVFRESSAGGWTQLGQSLHGEKANDYFAFADLDQTGDRLVVSAAGVSVDGFVKIYDLINGSWTNGGEKLIPATSGSGGGFGRFVSMSADGQRILIDESLRDESGVDAGAATVFYQPASPQLGPTRTLEANGTHSDLADADSDDGVTFGELRVGQTDATVTVNVQNAPLGAKLDAWIDFNGDGNWGGKWERIAASINVENGESQIRFDIPSDAIAGWTQSRFRLSTGGNLGPKGFSGDGEVEDYMIELVSPIASNNSFSEGTLISNFKENTGGQKYAHSLDAGDIDNDGDIDLLAVSRVEDKIRWYENIDSGTFVIHELPQSVDEPIMAKFCDLDGDGDKDIVSASLADDTIAWFENVGDEVFEKRILTSVLNGANSVHVSDLDNDGDFDILAGSAYGTQKQLIWLQNDGAQNFSTILIDEATAGIALPSAIDLDSDGDLDIVATVVGSEYRWYENDGNESFTARTISVGLVGDGAANPVDIDLDGDIDLVATSRSHDRIFWLENDGNEVFTEHLISDVVDHPFQVFPVDIDSDGDIDLLSASAHDATVALYLNNGAQDFTYRSISVNGGPKAVLAADISGNGVLDVVSAEQANNQIFWYANSAIPVLDNSADPILVQTQEDAVTPTGAVGTLVSALIDTDGPLDNFSDADGDLPGIAITGVNLQEGTLWFSENNGMGWQQVGTVSDGSPRLLAADADSRLYFQPAADFSGTINDVITFKAWDRTFILQQLGTDIDGEAAGDESGRTVSMSADGQTVAIGASGNDDNGIDSGHVRVYQWTGSAWQQQGADIDGEAAGDEAGKWNSLSLSSDGQMVAIGALYNDGNGNDSGHVRIYQWSGSAWQQLGADIDGEAAGDASGFAVSLSSDGQTVATGALYNGGNGALAGHVRIHQWTGSEWQQLGADIDGEAAGDRVHSVSLSSDGQTVAIGAHRNDGNGADSGSTRVYQWTGSAWQQLGSDIDGEAAGDQSGYSLSLSSDGQIVAIGALYNDGNGTDSGSTRVYHWTGTAWQQMGSDIDGEAAEDLSGVNLSLSSNGQTVAVAAHSNDANGNRAGQVRLYGWSGSEWEQLGKDIDGEAAEDLSGGSVSLSSDGQRVAVGAMYNDGNGVDSGHVRIYQVYSVQSTAADTVTVNVTPVNDPPVLESLPDIAIDEDGVVHGAGTNLKLFASDVDSDESKLEFRIVNLTEIDPQFGLSIGMDTQSDSFALRGDSTIHVHPAANFFGSTQVTIEARDPEGDVSSQQTFNLVINSVNDRPVLDPSADLALPEVVEDSGYPVGQAGTLVSALIDENGPLANFSDIDGLAPGVAVIGKNIAIDKIWFSTDDGQNWQEVGSVSVSESLVLDADATTRIYAQPADDVSGDLADALTIKAWDQTGGYSNGQVGVDSTSSAFSSQIDTVFLSVEPSPSSAEGDFYAPLFDGTETFVISKSDFLANDTLGNGESIDSVAITTDPASSAGGTISVDGDVFTYTRPANWFSGIDTFGYTLADGGSTSTATVTILSGLNGDTLTIAVEPGRDHEVTLRYLDEKLVMVDHVTQATLLNIPRELVPANIDVVGAPASSNIVTLKELSSETPGDGVSSWSYQGGSASDELTVLGSGSQWAWLSSDPQVENDVTVELKQLTSSIDTYTMIAVEKVNVEQVDRIEFSDPYLQVSDREFSFQVPKPINLPVDTSIVGGTLSSTSPVALDSGESLVGAGIVDGPFGGVTGSLIRATGNLEIGTDQSSDGFRTDGRLETGVHVVTINDSNRATLGELTTLGSESQAGVLVAKHGLTVPFTGNIEGYGTVDTTSGETTSILLNNGSIVGNSSDEPITLTATVKGVGTMTNVVLDGTFTPGFSPTLSVNGDLVYSDRNTVEIELGGYLPGSGHDKIEHRSAFLDGKLVAKLIDGYQPRPGAMFEILKSLSDFTGAFDSIELPSFDNGLRLEEIVDSRSISLETVFDTVDELHVLVSEQSNFEISNWHDDALKVRGSKFKAQVTPQHGFRSETSWFTDHAFMKDDVLIQSTTDGVNRIDIAGSRWKNFVSPHDINNDGRTSVLDALTIINELSRGSFVDLDTNQLTPPSELSEWPGVYYDTNGDDRGTVLDALLVINEIARTGASSGEGELADVAIEQWSRDLTPISTAKPTSDPLTQNPSFPLRIFSSSPEADNFVSSPSEVVEGHKSMEEESLNTLDESLLSLLAE